MSWRFSLPIKVDDSYQQPQCLLFDKRWYGRISAGDIRDNFLLSRIHSNAIREAADRSTFQDDILCRREKRQSIDTYQELVRRQRPETAVVTYMMYSFDSHSTDYSQGKVGHKVEREYECLEKGYACIVSRIELLNGYPVQFTMDPVCPIVRQREKQKPPRQ